MSSERVDRHVRELAKLTGQSVTDAIDDAVVEKIVRLRPRKPDPDYVRDLQRMAEEIRVMLPAGTTSSDDKMLYDEDGVPH